MRQQGTLAGRADARHVVQRRGANGLGALGPVGAARKRALLAHFGSAKAVGRANLSDLKAVDGVSDTLAETIYAFFNGEG